MNSPTEIDLMIRKSKMRTTPEILLSMTMDSSINGRTIHLVDPCGLLELKWQLRMIGIAMLVLMLAKRQETTLPHIELLKTSNLSGLRTILWMELISKHQELMDHNQ